MHEMGAEDVRDSGGVKYPSDASPATRDEALDYGVLWHENLNVVKRAGLTPDARPTDPEDAIESTQVAQAIGETEDNGDLKAFAATATIDNDSEDFDITFMIHTLRRLVTLRIPKITLDPDGAAAVIAIGPDGGGAMPDTLRPDGPAADVGHYDTILVLVDGVLEVCKIMFPTPGGPNDFQISRMDDSNFPTVGAFTIQPKSFTYFHASQPF